MAAYKGLTIHGSPSEAGGQALDANFTELADFVCAIGGQADVDTAITALTLTPILITQTKTAIGVTSTDGVVLQNTTAAAAGAQQMSPRLRLAGRGWKTDATAASQAVEANIELLPVQGAAAPTANLNFNYAVNGGAFATIMTLSSAGNLGGAGTNTALIVLGSEPSSTVPVFTFKNDTNTGIGTGNADRINLICNGSTQMSINPSQITMGEGVNYSLGTSTGTKLGSATTQKLGFWNATPVVQPAAQADASGGATIDAEARTALNGLLAKLRTIGIIAT